MFLSRTTRKGLCPTMLMVPTGCRSWVSTLPPSFPGGTVFSVGKSNPRRRHLHSGEWSGRQGGTGASQWVHSSPLGSALSECLRKVGWDGRGDTDQKESLTVANKEQKCRW